MVALQIRDVSPDVRDILAERARQRGQSLQAYLLALVNREASFSRNLEILRSYEGRDDGTRFTPEEAQRRIDARRAERDGRFDDKTAHPGAA